MTENDSNNNNNNNAASPAPNDASCLDTMNETLGMGTMEVETTTTAGQRPTSVMSKSLSLPNKTSGLCGTSSNLINSIVGAGIIGIPFALREAGIVAGVLLLILVAWCTDKSLRMIVNLASFHPKLKHLGVKTFEDLMMLPFGGLGRSFILVNMFVLAYGAMTAYLLIIKDTVPIVLGVTDGPNEGSFVEREVIMIATSVAIILPLSLQRDMASLACTSLVSVAADVLLVLFVAAFSDISNSVQAAGGFGAVIARNAINPRLFIGLGVLSTAMACQHSAFIVSESLTNKTSARWATVTFHSLTTATALCAVLGITGYLGFLDETQGDVLNNFDDGNEHIDAFAATGARALLAITMFFTYPMEMFVARHVAMQLMYGGDMDGGDAGCWNRRVKWTVAIFLLTMIPALLVDDLGPVLSITGSLGGSCLSYIAPGLAYLGVNGSDFLAMVAGKVDSVNRKPDLGAGDVPVDGDASATMQTVPPPSVPTGPKPWWWYPTLMPLWCSIASHGANGMHERLSEIERQHGSLSTMSPSNDGIESIGPVVKDYYVSIFFILFGILAAVVGLITNVYVEVQGIFFTPN